jgi:hypothetical protein
MTDALGVCCWCGKPLGEHIDFRAPDAPVPRTPCLGLKANFLERTKSTTVPERHCPTCICGRRAPVQATHEMDKGPGTIAWQEHVVACAAYERRSGTAQSPDRVAKRGGFSYSELVHFLGRIPTTWSPRR